MGFLQRLMANTYDGAMAVYESHAHERRRALIERIPHGARVLELGPGTGVNLEHLAALGRTDITWRGVEPSPPMRLKLAEKVAAGDLTAPALDFVDLTPTGHIEADDHSADVVLSTLVLCSVPDQVQTLAEVHRLLAPGGQFLFMEHVGAPRGTTTRRVQTVATPFWRIITDGCCLNRDTESVIRGTGFTSVETETYTTHRKGAPFFVRPHVAGCAIK